MDVSIQGVNGSSVASDVTGASEVTKVAADTEVQAHMGT